MFKLISFQSDGDRLTDASQVPAFYALTYRGHVVGYFTTLQALRLACESCQACMAELNQENRTRELELAA